MCSIFLLFWWVYKMAKVVGNFGLNGWFTSIEERVKGYLINYRCCNSAQSILYTNIYSLGSDYNQANHDPYLYASLIKKHLGTIYTDAFGDSVVVETEAIDSGKGLYEITISVALTANDKRYDLRTILKSNGDNLFDEYDKTYYDFKF